MNKSSKEIENEKEIELKCLKEKQEKNQWR